MSKLSSITILRFIKKPLVKHLLIFIIINLCFYWFIVKFNNLVPFSHRFYSTAVHFYDDPRIKNQSFNLLKSISVWDGQWYLEIAKNGYPKIDINKTQLDIESNQPHKYAFFPLYPLILSSLNLLINNIELTALLLSSTLLIINFCLLHLFISKIDKPNIAAKTVWLLFLCPWALFYRFYFSEGLFLTILLLFVINLFKKNYFKSSLFLSLLLVTRANGLLLIPLLFCEFIKYHRQQSIKIILFKCLQLLIIIFLPLSIWLLFNYLQTNNFLTILKVRNYGVNDSLWHSIKTIINPLLSNLYRIIQFPYLSFHAFTDSKVEVITVILTGLILKKSRKVIDSRLWLIAFVFWLFPLITTSLISYSRYQIVSFPLFYYLAKKTNQLQYSILIFIFTLGLFCLSLYFINWYWVG